MDQKWRHYLVFIVSIHPRLIQEINCSPKLVMGPEVQVEKFYGPVIRLFLSEKLHGKILRIEVN